MIKIAYSNDDSKNPAKIEAGAMPNFAVNAVKKIADAFGVSLDDVMK